VLGKEHLIMLAILGAVALIVLASWMGWIRL
jgi:hypothetical protein